MKVVNKLTRMSILNIKQIAPGHRNHYKWAKNIIAKPGEDILIKKGEKVGNAITPKGKVIVNGGEFLNIKAKKALIINQAEGFNITASKKVRVVDSEIKGKIKTKRIKTKNAKLARIKSKMAVINGSIVHKINTKKLETNWHSLIGTAKVKENLLITTFSEIGNLILGPKALFSNHLGLIKNISRKNNITLKVVENNVSTLDRIKRFFLK